MSVPSTLTWYAGGGSPRDRRIASVYGSSPLAHPALHARTGPPLRDAASAGTTTSVTACTCPRWRKKRVSPTRSDSIRSSSSRAPSPDSSSDAYASGRASPSAAMRRASRASSTHSGGRSPACAATRSPTRRTIVGGSRSISRLDDTLAPGARATSLAGRRDLPVRPGRDVGVRHVPAADLIPQRGRPVGAGQLGAVHLAGDAHVLAVRDGRHHRVLGARPGADVEPG